MKFSKIRKIFKKDIFTFFVFVLLSFGFVTLFFLNMIGDQIKFQSASLSFFPIKNNVTLTFVGDIMLDRGVEYKIKQQNDWNFPFLKIKDSLKGNLIFGNLESQISDKGTKIGSIYSFRADPQSIEGLVFSKFNILSVANNHFLDYGRDSFLDSLKRLKEKNIDYVGGGENQKEAFSPIIKDIKETKVAFLAYSNIGPVSWQAKENKPGIAFINYNDLERVKKEIEEAKKKSDILVISIHWGEEYTQSLTEFQKTFSKSAIDAGADVIIGHHPHVVQKYEKYKDGYIFYSLGNFLFDQGFSKETMEGLIVEAKIENKKIKEIYLIKTEQDNNFQIHKTSKEKIY